MFLSELFLILGLFLCGVQSAKHFNVAYSTLNPDHR